MADLWERLAFAKRDRFPERLRLSDVTEPSMVVFLWHGSKKRLSNPFLLQKCIF